MATLDHYSQGYFTGDGNAHLLNIRSDVDAVLVRNLTKTITPVGGTGVQFYWQRGMAQNSAIQTTSLGVSTQITTNGIALINTADPQVPGPQLSGTSISTATPPLVASGNTGTLQNGDIVEVYNAVGALQFQGYQFTVGNVVSNTQFELSYAPTIAVGSTVNYRVIKFQPMYYPRRLFISSVSQATQAVVVLTVTHNLTVGQRIVFGVIPAMYGMTQLSGLRATIVAINTTTNSITIDIDTTGFTAFAFPLTAVAATAHTEPSIVPFGDGLNPLSNPLGNQSVLDGATRNLAILGIYLGAGANGPAGIASDQIFWQIWKAEQLQTTYFA